MTCWLFASHIQNLSVIHTVRYRRYWPSSIQDACQVSGHALSITAFLQLSELSACPVFGRSQVRILLRTLCLTPLNLYIHHLFCFIEKQTNYYFSIVIGFEGTYYCLIARKIVGQVQALIFSCTEPNTYLGRPKQMIQVRRLIQTSNCISRT